MSFIVKIILLRLSLVLSLPAAGKTQYLIHVNFHSILQLINGVSNDLEKFLKYFNGTEIVAFFRIPLALFGDLKLAAFPILLLKLFASSFKIKPQISCFFRII